MKKSIIILVIVLCSCEQNRIGNEFYDIVDNLLRYRLNEVGILYIETTPVCKGPISDGPPTHIDLVNLNRYAQMNFIDSSDIDFLFKQVDSSIFKMNPKKLGVKTVSQKEISKLFDSQSTKDFFSFLKENYNTSCYAKISTPLISKDKKKVILYVDVISGYLRGQGYEFIFRKLNGKWHIVLETGTWES